MFLKGTIYTTTDTNMVQQMSTSSKIFILDRNYLNMVGFANPIVGEILLPPYESFCYRSNNDMVNFTNSYYKYLSENQDINQFLSVMFMALMQGTNILIYITNDDYELYFNTLQQYIMQTFGILIGTEKNQFLFDANYTWYIVSILYINELLTTDEFFMLYPQGLTIADMNINKLVEEINPYVKNTSFDSYKNYFTKYKESIKLNGNKVLKTAIRRGR